MSLRLGLRWVYVSNVLAPMPSMEMDFEFCTAAIHGRSLVACGMHALLRYVDIDLPLQPCNQCPDECCEDEDAPLLLLRHLLLPITKFRAVYICAPYSSRLVRGTAGTIVFIHSSNILCGVYVETGCSFRAPSKGRTRRCGEPRLLLCGERREGD